MSFALQALGNPNLVGIYLLTILGLQRGAKMFQYSCDYVYVNFDWYPKCVPANCIPSGRVFLILFLSQKLNKHTHIHISVSFAATDFFLRPKFLTSDAKIDGNIEVTLYIFVQSANKLSKALFLHFFAVGKTLAGKLILKLKCRKNWRENYE